MSKEPAVLTGTHVGRPTTRVDGRLKVTGAADYAFDVVRPGMLHAVLVGSTCARGRITELDTTEAEAAPGVRLILTHRNRGKLRKPKTSMLTGMTGSVRLPLADAKVHHVGQYVAMVVAASPEEARAAARLVRVTYDAEPHAMTYDAGERYRPSRFQTTKLNVSRGHAERDYEHSPVRLDQTYDTPHEHPSPMELHGTLAWFEDDALTVRNTTQWILGDVGILSQVFGLSRDDVHVHAPYLGGMFGSKAITGAHVVLTVLAAKQLGCAVKTVLDREQVFTNVGRRSATKQRFELGARTDGKLLAMRHATTSTTSELDEFTEPTSITSRMLYDVPSYASSHELVRTHTVLPGWMRAPGETPCQFAQESAIDELAAQLGIDPIVLRRRNDPHENPDTGKPFSCKHALECFERGAERFGWNARGPVGSRREGNLRIGYGVAAATYPGNIMGAKVEARLEPGDRGVRLVVKTAASDVGTGLYTVVVMVAAETLGLPADRVTSLLGDSTYPFAAVAGGSNLTASVSPAVYEACTELKQHLFEAAVEGPLAGVDVADLDVEQGDVYVRSDRARRVSIDTLVREPLEATATTLPVQGGNRQWSFQSFGAVFAEVAVDDDLCTVRVRRLLGVYDAGRIVNPKAARSQILGGMVFGLGMALLEELVVDPHHGRFINTNLADYRIPVNADMPSFDISFIDEPDLEFNPIGCRGIGEIGNPGTAAAIANAVYHATGKRIRSLPITPEKLLEAE